MSVSDRIPHSSATDPATYLNRVVGENEKLKLLNDRWEPPSDFSFPSTGGQKYHPLWEHEYSWLRYSVSKDAAFCAYCLLFVKKRSGKGVHLATFQNVGFRDWKNATTMKA